MKDFKLDLTQPTWTGWTEEKVLFLVLNYAAIRPQAGLENGAILISMPQNYGKWGATGFFLTDAGYIFFNSQKSLQIALKIALRVFCNEIGCFWKWRRYLGTTALD